MHIDRTSIRARPTRLPVMHQTWDKLLFMHWSFEEEIVRPLIPERLDVDTYDGLAWVGVTPFTIRNLRPNGSPAFPLISSTHELNVRTYVHLNGVPGVWFFSLDASNPLAVLGARMAYALPYFLAKMSLEATDDEIRFTSRRSHLGAPPAALSVHWNAFEPLADAQPTTRDFFLTERYCLYAQRDGRIARTRIYHRPWSLRRATVSAFTSSMLESHGLPTPEGEPLLHAQAAPLNVEVWRPERV